MSIIEVNEVQISINESEGVDNEHKPWAKNRERGRSRRCRVREDAERPFRGSKCNSRSNSRADADAVNVSRIVQTQTERRFLGRCPSPSTTAEWSVNDTMRTPAATTPFSAACENTETETADTCVQSRVLLSSFSGCETRHASQTQHSNQVQHSNSAPDGSHRRLWPPHERSGTRTAESSAHTKWTSRNYAWHCRTAELKMLLHIHKQFQVRTAAMLRPTVCDATAAIFFAFSKPSRPYACSTLGTR